MRTGLPNIKRANVHHGKKGFRMLATNNLLDDDLLAQADISNQLKCTASISRDRPV